MKKVTKRIILSIVSLAFIAVALGTTTFAWFTLSNVATISNITGEVQAGEGLEVALGVNGSAVTDYRTNLTTSDWTLIMNDINSNITSNEDFTFGAVSTSDAIEFKKLEVAGTPPYPGKTVLSDVSATSDANETKGYLEFTIHFKSDTAGSINWTEFNFNDSVASNAARIAIIGDDNNTVAVQKAYGGGNTVVVQEAGQYTELYNKGNVIIWDGKLITTNEQGFDFTFNNDSNNDPITPEALLTDPETVDLISTSTQTQLATDGSGIATLTRTGGTGPFEASVIVRVWLEGWDAETFDDIFGQTLDFNLKFEKQ